MHVAVQFIPIQWPTRTKEIWTLSLVVIFNKNYTLNFLCPYSTCLSTLDTPHLYNALCDADPAMDMVFLFWLNRFWILCLRVCLSTEIKRYKSWSEFKWHPLLNCYIGFVDMVRGMISSMEVALSHIMNSVNLILQKFKENCSKYGFLQFGYYWPGSVFYWWRHSKYSCVITQ